MKYICTGITSKFTVKWNKVLQITYEYNSKFQQNEGIKS